MGGKVSTASPHRRAGKRSDDNTPISAELASKLFTTVLSLWYSALRNPSREYKGTTNINEKYRFVIIHPQVDLLEAIQQRN